MPISTKAAFEMTQTVARTEGLPIGVSAATAICGAINLAKRPEMKGKNIVVVLPDSVERYLSDQFYEYKEPMEGTFSLS